MWNFNEKSCLLTRLPRWQFILFRSGRQFVWRARQLKPPVTSFGRAIQLRIPIAIAFPSIWFAGDERRRESRALKQWARKFVLTRRRPPASSQLNGRATKLLSKRAPGARSFVEARGGFISQERNLPAHKREWACGARARRPRTKGRRGCSELDALHLGARLELQSRWVRAPRHH